ncbi:MAG: DM13 domain-containing protein [Parcubacteria group bacterium]|nr:DM13 domain-containing protein [Parcubacteria group bacterium]
MKRILFITSLIIALPVAWYLIAPVFISTEVDDVSPLTAVVDVEENKPEFDDAMDDMNQDEHDSFDVAVQEVREMVVEIEDPMDMEKGPELIASGLFLPRAHEVEGIALVIDTGEETILRFEDFETINGPNLHIYLSSDLGISDAIDLGEIRATKGNVNYELPDGVDLERYNNVLVWCEPFKVLFSYVEL